jgi:allantoate deiminase
VEAIAAQTRIEFLFSGHANHAGTTPMHLRKDALAAAAEWISAVERTAQNSAGLVATVGQIEAKPGAVNVIPGAVRLSLDIRHKSDDVCAYTVSSLVRDAQEIADRRGLAVTHNVLLCQCAIPMDAFLVAQIEQAIKSVGCEPHRMTSGAGHDAMILAERVPVAMIFLHSPGGISHDPAESVLIPDVAKALECGLGLLDQLASSSQFLKRTARA